jgi:hypothetical protein
MASLRSELTPYSKCHIFNCQKHQHVCAQADSRMMQARAFLQYPCSVELRARWLFLEEKATRHPAFALHQLEKCSSTTVVIK